MFRPHRSELPQRYWTEWRVAGERTQPFAFEGGIVPKQPANTKTVWEMVTACKGLVLLQPPPPNVGVVGEKHPCSYRPSARRQQLKSAPVCVGNFKVRARLCSPWASKIASGYGPRPPGDQLTSLSSGAGRKPDGPPRLEAACGPRGRICCAIGLDDREKAPAIFPVAMAPTHPPAESNPVTGRPSLWRCRPYETARSQRSTCSAQTCTNLA